MSTRSLTIIIVGVVFFGLFWSSFYIVNQHERAVLLRFGEVEIPNVEPGMHFAVPIMNRLRKFDARLQVLDSKPQNFLTREKKRLQVDFYVLWRVADVQTFYTKTNGDRYRTGELLLPVVEAGLRNSFGERLMAEVISDSRDDLIQEATQDINQFSMSDLGIEVLDVRVKGIDLPPQASESVYQRMSSEREKEARKFRYEGRKQAEQIRAQADRKARTTLAEAYNKAETLRGEGDATAAAIYAKAYGKDQSFYRFIRSLSAYEASFESGSDVLIVSPDSEFFRYLNSLQGK